VKGKTIGGKTINDRKMEGRKMIRKRNVYGCSLLRNKHCFGDTKLHVSVSHFSVIAFVQANLTLPVIDVCKSKRKMSCLPCQRLQAGQGWKHLFPIGHNAGLKKDSS
jgi:hypothetical protein